MTKLVLSIEIIETGHPWRYRVDCDQIAGSPPVGMGRNVVAAVADWMAQYGIQASAILTENDK